MSWVASNAAIIASNRCICGFCRRGSDTGNPSVYAAMRRAQFGVDEVAQRVDLGTDLRIAIERVDRRQRQQHKGVIVGVAQRIEHRAIRPSGGRSPACRRAISPWPAGARAPSARWRCPRDTSPSALPWRSSRSAAPARTSAAARAGPRGRPHRADRQSRPCRSSQPSVDHSGRECSMMRTLQRSRRYRRRIVCRRSAMRFGHGIPWNISVTTRAV